MGKYLVSLVAFYMVAFVSMAVQASDAAQGAGGMPLSVVCPNCGKSVAIGRPGQVSQENCAREICVSGEQEPHLCYGADAGIFSKYVSRGMVTTEDPVFQPNAWLSYKDFTVGVWGNMDLTGVNASGGRFNELDFTLDYSHEWDGLNISFGGIYYTFPNTGGNDTAEVYAGIGYDMLFQPGIAVYYDCVDMDGFYVSMGIGHGFELPAPADGVEACLELSALAGWGSRNFNGHSFGSNHGAFTDVVLTAELPIAIAEHYGIKPMISYSSVLDRTIRTKNQDNDNLVFGLTVSAGF